MAQRTPAEAGPGGCAVFVLAFTLPKLYELRKEEIDGAVSQTYSQGHKVYHQNVKPYLSSIPRASGASSGVSSGATSGTTHSRW